MKNILFGLILVATAACRTGGSQLQDFSSTDEEGNLQDASALEVLRIPIYVGPNAKRKFFAVGKADHPVKFVEATPTGDVEHKPHFKFEGKDFGSEVYLTFDVDEEDKSKIMLIAHAPIEGDGDVTLSNIRGVNFLGRGLKVEPLVICHDDLSCHFHADRSGKGPVFNIDFQRGLISDGQYFDVVSSSGLKMRAHFVNYGAGRPPEDRLMLTVMGAVPGSLAEAANVPVGMGISKINGTAVLYSSFSNTQEVLRALDKLFGDTQPTLELMPIKMRFIITERDLKAAYDAFLADPNAVINITIKSAQN